VSENKPDDVMRSREAGKGGWKGRRREEASHIQNG
jgi:hypothetical protein